jgi:hypothetical protein
MKQSLRPFEVLAGSSHGLSTPRQTAIELIAFCNLFEFSGTGADVAIQKAFQEKVQGYTYELASTADENSDDIFEIQEDLATLINEYVPLPVSCTLSLQDNEWIVLPYIDDELPRLDECPETFVDDVIYSVNDHGNVDCYEWIPAKQEYRNVWSMV